MNRYLSPSKLTSDGAEGMHLYTYVGPQRQEPSRVMTPVIRTLARPSRGGGGNTTRKMVRRRGMISRLYFGRCVTLLSLSTRHFFAHPPLEDYSNLSVCCFVLFCRRVQLGAHRKDAFC